jgi:hypothetical protein
VDTIEGLALVRGQATDLMNLFNCAILPTLSELCGSLPGTGDCEMGCCLRFQDGKLQMLNCGVWEDVAGQEGNEPGTLQPTGEGQQPAPGGGCTKFRATLQSGSQWLLPVPVNSGDTITISDFSGATHESPAIPWVGPQGQDLFFGTYQTGTEVFFDDTPVPSAPNQSVIVYINGFAYSPLDGPFTVPGGVVNVQPYFDFNVVDVDSIGGFVQFTVEVCNEQVPDWTHEFDFSKGTGKWFAISDGGALATWSPDGWQGANDVFGGCAPDPTDRGLLFIQRNLDSSQHISTVRIIGSTDTNNGPGNGDRTFYYDASTITLGLNASTGAFDVTVSPGATVTTSIKVLINSLCFAAPPSITVNKVIVTGTGTDPFLM